MGIPHLAKLLQPYREPIESKIATEDGQRRRVVVDGPGLAHHAYHIALSRHAQARQASGTIPGYAEVGAVVVTFLDSLHTHGIDITAIYFDGKLPDAKRGVRLARTAQYLRQLATLRSLYPKTAPLLASLAPTSLKTDELFSAGPVPSQLKLLPPPPFVVPGVIEILLESSYAMAVHMVPGEADIYCASDVKVNGGLVLTGDSDLLVHNLGKEGGVVFFNDISIAHLSLTPFSEGHIKAQAYVPVNIARRLQLSSIAKIAFVVGRNKGKRLSECLEIARKSQNTNRAYLAFAAEYEVRPSLIESLASPVLSKNTLHVPIVDPRISEYLLQSPAAKGTMYLPFLIDDPSRFSAWACGTDLRRLGYTILHLESDQSRTVTIEVQRRGHERVGEVPVHLLPSSKILPNIARIVSDIDGWQAQLNPQHRTCSWRGYLVTSLIRELEASGRPLPSTPDIKSLLTSKSGSTDWSYVHLQACYQAQAYSLRVLRQLLDVVLGKTRDAKIPINHVEGLQQLRICLDSLPSIAALFDATESTEHTEQCLRVIREQHDIANDPEEKGPTPRGRRKKSNQQAAPTTLGSESNRFAALAELG